MLLRDDAGRDDTGKGDVKSNVVGLWTSGGYATTGMDKRPNISMALRRL
jgi:hypothetical protein